MGLVLGRSSYIDDIAHGAPTWNELCDDLNALLYRLRYWNISVSLPKSEFGKETIPYLSHEIGAEGIRSSRRLPKALRICRSQPEALGQHVPCSARRLATQTGLAQQMTPSRSSLVVLADGMGELFFELGHSDIQFVGSRTRGLPPPRRSPMDRQKTVSEARGA
jgi:hypothetical protein